jgi:hypothetical protein
LRWIIALFAIALLLVVLQDAFEVMLLPRVWGWLDGLDADGQLCR